MRSSIFMGLVLMGLLGSLVLGRQAFAASTDQIQEKAGETAQATSDWASATKDEFKAKMQKNLAELQTQIDDLKAKAASHTGEAKKGMDRQLADLEAKKAKVQHRLDNASSASGRAWEKVKTGIGSAYEDLKKGFSQAKRELESKSE